MTWGAEKACNKSEKVVSQKSTQNDNFDAYFSCEFIHDTWVRTSLEISLDRISDDDMVKGELLDLRNNGKLRIGFEAMTLPEFWCKLVVAYIRLLKSVPILC